MSLCYIQAILYMGWHAANKAYKSLCSVQDFQVLFLEPLTMPPSAPTVFLSAFLIHKMSLKTFL